MTPTSTATDIAAAVAVILTRSADNPQRRRHEAALRLPPLRSHLTGCPAGLDPERRCRCRDLDDAEERGIRTPRRYR
jgi:hypothetical protein